MESANVLALVAAKTPRFLQFPKREQIIWRQFLLSPETLKPKKTGASMEIFFFFFTNL